VSDASGTTLTSGDGRTVVLGPLIKSGGAGSVYHVRDAPGQVAKLYHAGSDLRMYERRIAAMIELEPQLPELAQDGNRYVQLAWPDALLRDARGRFVGYLMPVVDMDATSELEFVLQERQARRHQLPTGLGAKVTLAANLCAVIAALHRERHHIVDLKPVNLRFYRRSLYMALLDCDGFSIQGRGERFEAPHYTPEYLAPEFHLRELNAAGEAQQDLFALAVIAFQLLNFGIHPFTGRPQSAQVPTDIPARIAGRWYAYGRRLNPALLPNLTSGHAAMPDDLRILFDRAFEDAPGGGTRRPSADEWSERLRGYAQRAEGKLVPCAREASHQHFAGLPCAACERRRTLASAQAAAASRPPRPRAVPRHTPMTIGWPTPPPPATVGATRSTTSNTIPPQVLARINQAWANQPAPPLATPGVSPALAAGYPRRPANMAAGRLPGRADPWLTGLFVLVLLAFLGGLAGLVLDAGRDAPVAAAPSAPNAPNAPNAQAAPARVDTGPLRAPTPSASDLDGQAREIGILSRALIEEDEPEVERVLTELHARARDRREGWRRQLEQARADGAYAGRRLSPDAVAEAGVEWRGRGWIALDQGDRASAAPLFAQALWADADDADAWLGYGLSTPGLTEAIGAVAMALLKYPDVATARARRDEYLPLAAHGDVGLQRQLEYVFRTAAPLADRERTRLPPGFVRLGEPFNRNAR
jgi:hypothetical protein